MKNPEKIWLILLVLTCCSIVSGTFIGNSSISNFFRLKKDHEILKERVDSLNNEVGELELEILKLEKSPHYAKKIMRDKYHTTGENEYMIEF